MPYIKSSWLDNSPIPYVIVWGQTNIDSEYIYNPVNKTLIIKCEDDYDCLVHKVKTAITCIMKEFNPDYIIKCDDDVYVDTDKLQEYVDLMKENNIIYHGKPINMSKGNISYFGIHKYKQKKNKMPYCYKENISYAYGPIYFLSKKACQVIIDHMDPEYCQFEDVNVGYTLKINNIFLNTDIKYNKYLFENNIIHYLNGTVMSWHDSEHISFAHSEHRTPDLEKGDSYMSGTEKWTVPYLTGGLGNQMFTISAAYITSSINNLPLNLFKFDQNKNHYFKSIYKNFSGIKTEPFKDNVNYKIIKQQNIRMNEKDEQIHSCWNPHTNALRCILFGAFHYYPHIIPYEKEIRNLFLSGLTDYRNNLLTKYNFDNMGFIHSRRGKYLLPTQYYEKALEKYDSSLNFFVVSDENEWIKSENFFKNERFTIFEGDELETLALMSLCTSGAISSGSSFGWWGAFLGAYEKRNPIIVPKKWVKIPDPKSLIPEEWMTITL